MAESAHMAIMASGCPMSLVVGVDALTAAQDVLVHLISSDSSRARHHVRAIRGLTSAPSRVPRGADRSNAESLDG
jgi:hypothetical protein